MKLYIKNMDCLRSKLLVKSEIEKLGLTCIAIDLGMVEVMEEISSAQLKILNNNLKRSGLELLDDNKIILVEKIKAAILKMIQYADDEPNMNDSDFISKELNYCYTCLSNTFSEVKGMTIQQYIILQKIEKVKELLIYDEFTPTEIAQKLHYSSVAHLTNQFREVTGHTTTYFKAMNKVRIKTPEEV